MKRKRNTCKSAGGKKKAQKGKKKKTEPQQFLAPLYLLENKDEKAWNNAYDAFVNPKYHKRRYTLKERISGKPLDEDEKKEAPIYLIPRVRGGPSYKDRPLEGIPDQDHSMVRYCPISKGYSMQALSSFSLGPIPGECLVLVNGAFSKQVTIAHIEGGGVFSLKRKKTFWQKARKPHRKVEQINWDTIQVDGKVWNALEWLQKHENLWITEWKTWNQHVALCGEGSFHWDGGSPVVGYCHPGQDQTEYLSFAQWKMRFYVQPAYQLIPKTPEYSFLMKLWKEERIPLGLLHPKAIKSPSEKALTRDFLQTFIHDPEIMPCLPYCVAAKMMDVPLCIE